MDSLWERMFRSFSVPRRGRTRVPSRERFGHFLRICDANDSFLTRLSGLVDLGGGSHPVRMKAVRAEYDALLESASAMVSALVAMSGGRYAELPGRLAAISGLAGSQIASPASGGESAEVLWPGDPDCLRPEVVGGKAANLCAIWRDGGIPVPGFFVVSARGYDRFVAVAGVAGEGRAPSASGGQDEAVSRQADCEEVRNRILEAEVPDDLARSIREAYRRLAAASPGMAGVAVRSSATVEDSAFSFAGQFETVLGVREEGLLDAYRRVVASKYRHEAVRYARLSGVPDEWVAMPVLVMAMVAPAASGVAWSRDPGDERAVVVTAVRGLAAAAEDGLVVPDRFVLDRTPPHEVTEITCSSQAVMLACSPGGGTIEVRLPDDAVQAAAITRDVAASVARTALELERRFGCPQDVEWAMGIDGVLRVVQSRPLVGREEERADRTASLEVEGVRTLLTGGTRACGGVAAGPVAHARHLRDLDGVPDGAVLVVPATSPRLSGIVDRVAAIVAESGSRTGHMASVAREFRVPMLVGVRGAGTALPGGMVVTVDASAGRIYEGVVGELLARRRDGAPRAEGVSRDRLARLLDHLAPLGLVNPGSPDFTAANCGTLHDVARFVHQKAVEEMFGLEGLSPDERREARRLSWSVPLEILVYDLGGGVAAGAAETVGPSDIVSAPFLALIGGLTDARLRWAGPVGFDLRGFMSVVAHSAADDQRYGEPSFVLCSAEYVHFSSRLAYHFATVDAMCSPSDNRNYVRFLFHGGAATADRRECRAHFLATVLGRSGFEVKRKGDRLQADQGKRGVAGIREALGTVGRLLGSARQMDMVMDSRATAEAYAEAFLAGDPGFEFARGGTGSHARPERRS